MTPVEHRFANKTLYAPVGKEEEIGTLPIYCDDEQCISCWRMSWRERLSALFFGRVWLSVLSGPTQPPVWFQTTREALRYDAPPDEEKKWLISPLLKILKPFFK